MLFVVPVFKCLKADRRRQDRHDESDNIQPVIIPDVADLFVFEFLVHFLNKGVFFVLLADIFSHCTILRIFM